ncbi:MAG: prolipoprotein diacylglyceryl transferase [Parachlamydiaceae bacterium]
MSHSLAWFYWNPPREAFTIPLIDLPVMWYGILFALGFVCGYFILIPILKSSLSKNNRSLSTQFADRLTFFIVIGTIVGARLGHVFFYDWPYYAANPLEIIMLRHGGLASHGGTLGVIISLLLFIRFNRHRFPEISLIFLMDVLVIPTAITATFIRLANFFNQEILGNKTLMPWGIIFGNAADGTVPTPRHPVQLYEAGAYLATFFILYGLWKAKGPTLKPGTLCGIFFILVFGSRFFIEFLKTPQVSWIDEPYLQMGQYLSIPFVLFGCLLLFLRSRTR